MHEYGLAADIVHGVQAEAGAVAGRRLASLDVEVGPLARLETETLAFWLAEELREHLGDPSIDAERIRVLRAPLTVTCRSCGGEASVPVEDELTVLDPLIRRCPSCASGDVDLGGGSGWVIHVGWTENGGES